jgi:hypothetical protein
MIDSSQTGDAHTDDCDVIGEQTVDGIEPRTMLGHEDENDATVARTSEPWLGFLGRRAPDHCPR